MGRQKIKIEPLPESQIKAKFKKRKSGVVKKASELGTLCGAQIALIIFSKDGEEVIDEAFNGTTMDIIERYRSQVHGRGDQSRRRQQRVTAASQVLNQQFQPNSDSSTAEGEPMDPLVQQDAAMDPTNMHQANQYMNSQPQQHQFMNPQAHQDQNINPQLQQHQFMNPQAHQDQNMNPQVQLHQFMNPQAQQDHCMNSQLVQQADQLYVNHQVQQADRYINPQYEQGQYMNPGMQQEVPTDPGVQQGMQYVNPHGQHSMTGISQMQQGMQYSRGTNFVDSSNYMQNMVGGNQQLHGPGHQTQFENQTNVRYNDQPSEPGYCN